MLQQKFNPISGEFDLITTPDQVTTTQSSSPVIGSIYYDGHTLKTWNGSFWAGAPTTVENFHHGNLSPFGDTILFSGFTANGGTATGSNGHLTDSADLNGSGLKARFGFVSTNVTTAANSFSMIINNNLAATFRYRLSRYGYAYSNIEWRQLLPAVAIDFANNPLLACVGFLSVASTATVNPLQGIYQRLPRVGETAFVKYVVREGGAETALDTDIPYTSNFVGWLASGFLYDGVSDTMYFFTQANSATSVKSIATFSVSYPTAFADTYNSGVFLIRNGTGAVNTAATIGFDKYERYNSSNYLSTI